MEFEWDEAKRQETKKLRGLDFLDAKKIWSDPYSLIKETQFVFEPRWAILGKLNERVHIAIFTVRAERVRIISFRRASKTEERHYEQSTKNDYL